MNQNINLILKDPRFITWCGLRNIEPTEDKVMDFLVAQLNDKTEAEKKLLDQGNLIDSLERIINSKAREIDKLDTEVAQLKLRNEMLGKFLWLSLKGVAKKNVKVYDKLKYSKRLFNKRTTGTRYPRARELFSHTREATAVSRSKRVARMVDR